MRRWGRVGDGHAEKVRRVRELNFKILNLKMELRRLVKIEEGSIYKQPLCLKVIAGR